MIKTKLFLMAIVLIASYTLSAQGVAINSDGSPADGSAMLDVKSTDMGMLIPRMTEAQRDVISSPATGLMIFQTDETAGFYYFDGTAWTSVGSSGGGTTYSVGDFAQGGIVFWLDETGQHGLVCAKEDQDGGSGVRWYAGTYGITQAKGDGPYAGEANTAIIIAAQVAIGDDGNTYAARLCNELQINEGGKTYGDWYLPSYEELKIMYQNKDLINAIALANNGSSFATYPSYWSSTEQSSWAYFKTFNWDGYTSSNYKSSIYLVRAVRAF